MPHPDELLTRRPRVPMRRRALSSILADLEALTNYQARRVWDHVGAFLYDHGQVVPRFLLHPGLNSEALQAVASYALRACNGRMPGTARLLVVALWCQDNPVELVAPAWCPSVNVRGDAPLS